MIRLRTAAALAAGAVAALAIGGAALASGSDDPSGVDMLPNGDVIAAPSATDDSVSPSPSASESSAPAATPPGSPSPSSSSSSPSASSADAISLDAAKAIAVKAAGGGWVTDVERETEHGRAVWDIEVRNGAVEHDIDVDRATGDVLRHRGERDDDASGGHSGHGSDD